MVPLGRPQHFVVDEALDRHVLDILARRDADAVAALPLDRLNSGSSEIRNSDRGSGRPRAGSRCACWTTRRAIAPEAGTGCRMAFAVWD